MIRLQLQHLLVMDVPILLNWAGVYLGNSIYLFVAIVLGISEVRVLTHFCCSLRSLEASLQKTGGKHWDGGWGHAALRKGLGQELGGSLGTPWLSVLVLSQEAALSPCPMGTTCPGLGTSSVIGMVGKAER